MIFCSFAFFFVAGSISVKLVEPAKSIVKSTCLNAVTCSGGGVSEELRRIAPELRPNCARDVTSTWNLYTSGLPSPAVSSSASVYRMQLTLGSSRFSQFGGGGVGADTPPG